VQDFIVHLSKALGAWEYRNDTREDIR
jgi:hypothetical protein